MDELSWFNNMPKVIWLMIGRTVKTQPGLLTKHHVVSLWKKCMKELSIVIRAAWCHLGCKGLEVGSQSKFPSVSTGGHWEQKPASQGGTFSGAARRGLQGMHFQVDGQSHGEDGVSVGVWISVGREVQGAKPGAWAPHR